MHSVLSFPVRRVAGASLWLVVVLAPGTFASSQCPQNSVTCSDVAYSTDPAFSRACAIGFNGHYTSAGYNIPAGTLSASDGGYNAALGAGAVMEDNYEILGPAPGTPLTLTARLHVTGSSSSFVYPFGCPAYASALLREGSSGGTGSGWGCYHGAPPIDATFTLPVAAVAGQAFLIHCEVYASGGDNAGASMSGTLDFVDLPPGAGIISCNGYQQGTPLLVHPTTWGYVKTLYH